MKLVVRDLMDIILGEEIRREVEAFAKAPENSRFESVRERMAWLIEAGRAKTLEGAYIMAVNELPVRKRTRKAIRSAR